MTDHSAHVREALEATALHPPLSHSWKGRRSPGLPSAVRRKLTERVARDFLLYQLRSRLYADFYILGGTTASPQSWEGVSEWPAGVPFREALSAANPGGGCWDKGWQVLATSTAEVTVRGGGLTLWVSPTDCQSVGGGAVVTGEETLLRLPKELLGVSPGYYMGLGECGSNSAVPGPTVRIYWNIVPEGAVTFVRTAVGGLNRARIPFAIKILDDPCRFGRCDSAVIYLPKSACLEAVDTLIEVFRGVEPYLKPTTPVFTKRLAPGVGLAEDPGRSESFGQHRCRILAEGMVRSHERGVRTLGERLRVVAECFEEEGLSLTEPYLNPLSTDLYTFRFPG